MSFKLRILVVLSVLFTFAIVVLADFHGRQESVPAYEPTLPRAIAATSPALVDRVLDRDGRTILAREFVIKGGGRSAVIRYVYGSALGAAGVGRDRIVAGMIRHLRAPGIDAPWSTPELGGWYRRLLGDGGLCPRPLPHELVCSLDSTLCVRVYELLKREGRQGSVVVLDREGQVLALVDAPGPDVEESDRLPDSQHSLNVFLSWPPASTFKPIVAAYMLEYGRGDKDAAVVCKGGGECWAKHGHGVTRGLRQALVHSCNPWFRQQANSFPSGHFLAFLSDIGFFQEPSLGIPAIPAVTPARGGNTVDPEMAIGMQILASPLSLACAYGTISDPQGRRFAPRLLVRADGNPLPAPERPQVLRPNVTAIVREHLKAVASIGTASRLGRLLSGNVGAKTGTANGAALLAVVTPIDSPKFIVVIRIKGAESGASLCDLAAKIVRMTGQETR
ncbi:MAG: penicillin-binding transpeptidase domain-containing protein [Armatimonadota bacterium]